MIIKDAATNLLKALGNPREAYSIEIQTAIKMMHCALDLYRDNQMKLAALTPPASMTATIGKPDTLDNEQRRKSQISEAFDQVFGALPPSVGNPGSQAQWPAPGTNKTYAGFKEPNSVAELMQAQPRGPQRDHAHIQPHDLYKDGDTDAPDAIRDSNGAVVLGLCKRCGKGECELIEPCTPPAAAPLSNDAQAALKMPADPADVLATLVGHNGEMFDGTPANLDRLLRRYGLGVVGSAPMTTGEFYSRADVLRLFGNIV